MKTTKAPGCQKNLLKKSYIPFYFIFIWSTFSNGQTINELLSIKNNKIFKDSLISKKKINSSINTSLLIYDYNKEKGKKPITRKYSLKKTGQDYYVDAFIETYDQINLENLKSLGVEIYLKKKNILITKIPTSNLETILDLNGIKNIELATKAKPLLENALMLSSVDYVHTAINLNQSYTGEGVVVGIIDFGFDYTHPTFYNQDYTENRISRVWEQNNDNGNPPVINGIPQFGTELIGVNNIVSKGRDNDNISHGTHVAGIAAGSGGSSSSLYRGVAYDSEIVLVNPRGNPFNGTFNSNLILGIEYIFNYAKSVNKPAVVNLSLGTHFGPHDGTSYFDQTLDNGISSIGPGYIIVGAAGNEGDKNLHISKIFSENDDTLLSFLDFGIPNPNNYSPSQIVSIDNGIDKIISAIDIWGEVNENFEVAVNIYRNLEDYEALISHTDYFSTSNPCAPCISAFPLYDGDLSPGEDPALVTISTEIAYNGKPHASVIIDNSLQDDYWHKVLIEIKSNSGNVHAWEFLNNSTGLINFTNLNKPGATDGNTDFTVGEIGGTSNSIISVGSFKSRECFEKYYKNNEMECQFTSDQLLDISNFSSKGPTVDGRIKPTITAPGQRVVSSISSFDSRYYQSGKNSKMVVSNITFGSNQWYFGALQGTSMASPLVAGVVALMLEANPSLNFSEVETILQNSAHTESTGSSIPNNILGYGKIDAHEAIQNIESSLSSNDFDYDGLLIYPNPTNSILSFDNSKTKFQTLEVFNLIGQSVMKLNFKSFNERSLNISSFKKGVYFFKFTNLNVNKIYKIIIE